MIRIENDYIPLEGYTAMTVWPLLFVRRDRAHRYDAVADRHEHIHARQQAEMLAAGTALAAVLAVAGCGWWCLAALPLFYWWYGAEWLVKAVYYGDNAVAYRYTSFEREAYNNEHDPGYLAGRRPFAWLAMTGFVSGLRK